MFGIGATELLIVLGIVIVLFGARRLPELGSGVGKAIKNFKAGISGKSGGPASAPKARLHPSSARLCRAARSLVLACRCGPVRAEGAPAPRLRAASPRCALGFAGGVQGWAEALSGGSVGFLGAAAAVARLQGHPGDDRMEWPGLTRSQAAALLSALQGPGILLPQGLGAQHRADEHGRKLDSPPLRIEEFDEQARRGPRPRVLDDPGYHEERSSHQVVDPVAGDVLEPHGPDLDRRGRWSDLAHGSREAAVQPEAEEPEGHHPAGCTADPLQTARQHPAVLCGTRGDRRAASGGHGAEAAGLGPVDALDLFCRHIAAEQVPLVGPGELVRPPADEARRGSLQLFQGLGGQCLRHLWRRVGVHLWCRGQLLPRVRLLELLRGFGLGFGLGLELEPRLELRLELRLGLGLGND
jgi:sec-independent protein translocase protein TatA